MRNFWKESKKPFIALAPMADVTDCVFRKLIAENSSPLDTLDYTRVFWTEFVSADGLAHPEARPKLLVDLRYDEIERPIVAQIFGGKPENIRQAAELCAKLGFDGIDINMGCPADDIVKQCAGSALIKDPKLAREIIRAAIEGAGGLPVSVKTRIGYHKEELETWLPEILAENISALTVHLRTRKEMSLVPAHWELMGKILEIRDKVNKEVLVLGNGDVLDVAEAKRKILETGCDGVMIGRGIFGNPWLFRLADNSSGLLHPSGGTFPNKNYLPTLQKKLRTLVEHTKRFERELKPYKNMALMKKHYKAYVNGFDGAKELRMKLMEAESTLEIEKIVDEFLSQI